MFWFLSDLSVGAERLLSYLVFRRLCVCQCLDYMFVREAVRAESREERGAWN